jgi:nucleoside-diphosphate-sugar epimerase
MKILVTGAGGFLGSHVVERLLADNHDVTALMRPASRQPAWADRTRIHKIDLRQPAGLDEALAGIDTVVHVAAATSGSEDAQFASTVGGTEKLLAAMAKAGTKRLVLVSSFVVYDFAKAARVLDEDTPLDGSIYEMGGYAIAKYWQELIVLRHAKATGCVTSILRPGFIWGEGHTTPAGMGRKVGPLFFVIGLGNAIPLTHVANCADCIVAAATREAASGQVFNVVDAGPVSAWRFAGDYLKNAKIRAVRVPVPYWLGKAMAGAATGLSRWRFGKRGQLPSLLASRRFEAQFKPLTFSTAKLEQVLSWSPPLTYQDCLKRSFPK